MSQITKEITASIKAASTPKTNPYDTTGTVKRIEGDTVWVHIPGGVDETPVKKTISAKIGDSVQVRVSNGSAWLVGNASAPPTDDTRANMAYSLSTVAQEEAETAHNAAVSAVASAAEAESAAHTAKDAADTAMVSLSQVEDVLGVVTWVAEHGAYSLTSDVTINPNKTYYTVVGTAVVSPTDDEIATYYEESGGVYTKTTDTTVDVGKTYYYVVGTPVSEPDVADIGTYYELNISDALSAYVQTHLVLTGDGLYVMSDDSDWKVLVASDGVYIIDNAGTTVAKYKDTITLGVDEEGNSRLELGTDSINLISPAGTSAIYASTSSSSTVQTVTIQTIDGDMTRNQTKAFTIDLSSVGVGEDFGILFYSVATQVSSQGQTLTAIRKATLKPLTKGTSSSDSVSLVFLKVGGVLNPTSTETLSVSVSYDGASTITVTAPAFVLNPNVQTTNKLVVKEITQDISLPSPEVQLSGVIYFSLDVTASAGTVDGDMYRAITACGWNNNHSGVFE